MANDIRFVDPREWGDLKNELLKKNTDFTPQKADEVLHGRGIYKDIREALDIQNGVKPEEKYPELSGSKKSKA